MKKNIIIVTIILLIFVIYSVFTMPKTITKTYTGIAYKVNDPKFSQNIILKLHGTYYKKTKHFDGKMTINDKEYSPGFFASATTWICYIKDQRYEMGQVITSENLEQITLEITNKEMYRDVTKESIINDKLIISVPANNRADAIKLNDYLRQYGVIAGR